jgi:hypothetical protein
MVEHQAEWTKGERQLLDVAGKASYSGGYSTVPVLGVGAVV